MHADDLHGSGASAAATPAAARRPAVASGAWLRTTLARARTDLLYLAIALLTSVLAFAVWVTGLTVSVTLAPFVVGLPVILASAGVFRWCADLDRRTAVLVVGRPLRGRYADHDADRLLRRLAAIARDGQTWRDLAWLVAHSIVGFAFGCVAVAGVAEVVAVALLPAWSWAIPGGVDLGTWNVDSLGEALLAVPLAVPLAAIAVGLLRAMAVGHARLAVTLLDAGEARPAVAPPAAEPAARPRRRIDAGFALAMQFAVSAFIGFTVTLIWGLTGMPDSFWPVWVWFGLAIPLALSTGLRWAVQATSGAWRAVAVQGVLSLVAAGILVAVWALAGGGPFWPLLPLAGLAVALAAHALFAAVWTHLPAQRERALEERVDVLTRTRRGALDVQAAELRRIERDLHDGAQARLVALSMQLGRAEERLADQPEVAELVRRARTEAGAAIAELRDLARGIAPPVLADRGLVAAVEALGRRAANHVTVDASLDERLAPVVESAAYFVVAEALANAGKHAPEASVLVTLALSGDRLSVRVADDGPGGADLEGGGLRGLRGRVEALDGTLSVTSPPGRGTMIRAELPCGW